MEPSFDRQGIVVQRIDGIGRRTTDERTKLPIDGNQHVGPSQPITILLGDEYLLVLDDLDEIPGIRILDLFDTSRVQPCLDREIPVGRIEVQIQDDTARTDKFSSLADDSRLRKVNVIHFETGMGVARRIGQHGGVFRVLKPIVGDRIVLQHGRGVIGASDASER